MASKRGNPTARVGNYAQKVDSTGVDESMKRTMFGSKPKGMNKTEKSYVSGAKNKETAEEAVRRARKANR